MGNRFVSVIRTYVEEGMLVRTSRGTKDSHIPASMMIESSPRIVSRVGPPLDPFDQAMANLRVLANCNGLQ